MDESSNAQNRRSRRSRILMTATLDVSGCALRVTLRNLSAQGAQVEGKQLPVEGTDVLFRRGDLAVAGSIIWRKGSQAGIRFEQALDPASLLNHVATPRPRKADDFRRPGLASRGLTDQERMLAGNWLVLDELPKAGDH